MEVNKNQWVELHTEKRYRPKYPSEAVVQYVFRNFDRNGRTKVLDLGCGAGRHVYFMGKENIVPYGLDFSDEGIKHTQLLLRENGMAQYEENMKVGSLTEIPFEDKMFDGIICYGVLYYLPMEAIQKAVKEIYRVLKPNGRVMLVVRNTEDYRYCVSESVPTKEPHTHIINEADASKCAHSENGMLMHFFTEDEVKELLCEFSDLQIDKITETHCNGSFCDSNFIITAVKGDD